MSGARRVPTSAARRAGVLGAPVAHSRSPLLHLAAYRALGLDWTYERIECDAERLPGLVGGLGAEWVGLSVTKPGKFAALAVAAERTARAELLGSANTLVRTAGGWRADNTDVDGVAGALGAVGPFRDTGTGTGAVIGSGGTAPAALLALADLGADAAVVVARNPERAAALLALGERIGLPTRWSPLGDPLGEVAAVISTVPPDVAAAHLGTLAITPLLLDAVYDPWPTPLAAAVAAAGGRVVDGLEMLLHQGIAQVEQFTGRPAPEEVMGAALRRP